mmetsp:Transcript_2064/g.5438  ORF Transcript_2064/g.5438 Transcript_2064/m.5438 type:complete len:275 (-) Transcript_2064:63-887(-)
MGWPHCLSDSPSVCMQNVRLCACRTSVCVHAECMQHNDAGVAATTVCRSEASRKHASEAQQKRAAVTMAKQTRWPWQKPAGAVADAAAMHGDTSRAYRDPHMHNACSRAGSLGSHACRVPQRTRRAHATPHGARLRLPAVFSLLLRLHTPLPRLLVLGGLEEGLPRRRLRLCALDRRLTVRAQLTWQRRGSAREEVERDERKDWRQVERAAKRRDDSAEEVEVRVAHGSKRVEDLLRDRWEPRQHQAHDERRVVEVEEVECAGGDDRLGHGVAR